MGYPVPMRTYYAGQDLDAPCGRCKQETRHRVMTLTNGVPEKLICATCNSIHKFRVEKPSRPETSVRVARGPASVGAPKPKPAASPNRLPELKAPDPAWGVAQPYTPATRFEEGQWMDHPAFGLGKVQKRLGKKVDVLFREGLKTLISA